MAVHVKNAQSTFKAEQKVVKIGMLGCGTVGSGIIKMLHRREKELIKQTGSRLVIEKVLVQHVDKKRSVHLQEEVWTTDPENIMRDADIDVVIEVMGGIEPARTYILQALQAGKQVITANKDLMALHGLEILNQAAENGCDVYYEASVAGAIPIIRAVSESFAADRITKIMGIMNGTTNYILSKMSAEGQDFADVLREAQELGFAEADPTADVEGLDAARKMAILSTLAFDVHVELEDVECRGLTEVSMEDIRYAQQLGYEIKLLGIAEREEEEIEVSVQPTLVHQDHPLASVQGEYNAVYVYGEAMGETMFYGPGAGELPTASAVVSDLVSVVQNQHLGISGRRLNTEYQQKKIKAAEQMISKYFLRIYVRDEAGVMAQITKVLAEQRISMEKISQQPMEDGKAEIMMITYETSQSAVGYLIQQLTDMDVILELKSMYRVEGEKV